MKSQLIGLQLIRASLVAVGAFIAGAGGWLIWSALTNPDVRLKQPKWVEAGFDHSYWVPVLIVTLGGAVLVGAVMWKAYRRLSAGEDLYGNRFGQGLRRRGEKHLDG